MRWPAKIIATGLGTGYIPAPGTAGSALACIVWWLLSYAGFSQSMLAVLLLAIIIVGWWAASEAAEAWGKDPQKVTVDEWIGMWISLLFIPVGYWQVITAFILFRFFDILKPLFIRRLEKLKGATGIIADDILAGIYANLVLQLILFLI